MNRRDELAEKILVAFYANAELDATANAIAEMAFAQADAFLAKCAEAAPPERPATPPDAVWALNSAWNIASGTADESWGQSCLRLLAGRDRVKLEVRVVEDE